MGWDNLVNIFHSIEMKKKKPIGTLAIPEKDFKRPENLEIMSIFLGIHKWMKTLFKWKYLAIKLMEDTDYLLS